MVPNHTFVFSYIAGFNTTTWRTESPYIINDNMYVEFIAEIIRNVQANIWPYTMSFSKIQSDTNNNNSSGPIVLEY